MATAWQLTARVVRYGIPIEVGNGQGVRTLQPRCFALSCARYWVPLMGSHAARFYNMGRAVEYHEHDDSLVIDFRLHDGFLATRIMDGEQIEFSVDFSTMPGDEVVRVGRPELYFVAACIWPHRGACPGTAVLDLRPIEVPERELIAWSQPRPVTRDAVPAPQRRRFLGRRRAAPTQPTPVETSKETRERWGLRRDDFDMFEFMVEESKYH